MLCSRFSFRLSVRQVVSRVILRGSPLRYTTQCPIWAHFLNLTSVQFRDGALDRFDGAVLVYRLDVHGNNLAGIHVQKVLQQLVADVGCRDAQKTGGAKDAAHLEGAAVLERKGGGCNGILHGKPAFYKVFPVKVELAGTVHVEHIVHELQPLDTVQGFCLHPKPVEVVQQIVLDVVEPGLDLCHAFALHTKGDEFGLGQTIIALGKLLAQHLRILGTNIIKAGTTSPYSLYSESLASFTTGDQYDHHDADGFITLFGLPLKVRAMMLHRDDRTDNRL